MKKTTAFTLLAATLACGSAFADDFPPFFPENSTEATAPVQVPAPQIQGSGINTSLSQEAMQYQGQWSAGNGKLVFLFKDNLLYIKANGELVKCYYRIENGQLVICSDSSCSNQNAKYQIQHNGSSITVTIEGNPVTFVRVASQNTAQQVPQVQHTPQPQPMPQPIPQPLPTPQSTEPPMYIEGFYQCENKYTKESLIKFYFEFHQNTYKSYMEYRGMRNLMEIGIYSITGNQFNYTVQHAVDPKSMGASGHHTITLSQYGYIMTTSADENGIQVINTCTRLR
jgi:hypothetical protein